MKTVILILLLASACCLSAAEGLSETLQKGLFEEEANHDLDAAIQAYQKVINQSNDQRKFTATATFRLGECYRKQGKNKEAADQYERLLRDYSDQTVLTTIARQNLMAIGATSTNLVATAETASLTKVEADEVQKIKSIIKDSPDLVNVPDNRGSSIMNSGNSPLAEAASKGHLVVAQFLLANNADIEQRNKNGYTPLHLAALNGHKAMIELLLAHKANVNALSLNGATPLHLASWKGFKAVAQVLLANKADVNVKTLPDTRGADGLDGLHGNKTPLHLAAAGGLKAMIEFLLANGADVNAVNAYGATPLYVAVESGNVSTVDLLLKNKSDVNQGKVSPLFLAVSSGNEEIANLLLANGADIKVKESSSVYSGLTPLHLAVVKQNKRFVDLLLERGADVNALDSSGATPLHFAAGLNQMEIARLLLEKKAEPNVKANWRRTSGGSYTDVTPLQLAVYLQEKDMAELLLKNKADVNVTFQNSESLLHFAVNSRQKEIVDLLLAWKADVNAVNKSGMTPLNYVKNAPGGEPTTQRQVRLEIAQLLRSHGAIEDLQRRSFITASRKDRDQIQRIFEKDANGYNRYTLYEAIANLYSPQRPQGFPSGQNQPSSMAFPDFSRVKISRLTAKEGDYEVISLNLDAAFKSGDTTKDMWLSWGDIIEIPEQDHPINQTWQGLENAVGKALENALKRKVDIIVKGQTNQITLVPSLNYLPESQQGMTVMPSQFFNLNGTLTIAPNSVPPPRTEMNTFRLYDLVVGANVLRASSDITRVKVRRIDPASKETREMVFNLEKHDAHNDLWLRDADQIVIPEKDYVN